jgi:hypothetical protein
MVELDDELRGLAKRAEAISDFDDELNGRSYSRIVFNMGRAGDAALNVLGELDHSQLRLKIYMTDPDEIIKRCDLLIDAAKKLIVDLRHILGEIPNTWRPAIRVTRGTVALPSHRFVVP